MKIEVLKANPDRAGRHFVKFDDGSTMRLYRQTVEDFGLFPGRELDDAQMDALRKGAGEMSAKMRAVRIVSAASVSKRDLEQRLIHKGEDPDQAKQAVDWMSDLSLLDDGKVAQQVVARCISKGYGLMRAKQALFEKKVPREFWEQALEDYPDQEEKILEFLRSRLGPDPDQRELKRTVDALMRRGHSYSQIRKALSRLELESDEFVEDLE